MNNTYLNIIYLLQSELLQTERLQTTYQSIVESSSSYLQKYGFFFIFCRKKQNGCLFNCLFFPRGVNIKLLVLKDWEKAHLTRNRKIQCPFLRTKRMESSQAHSPSFPRHLIKIFRQPFDSVLVRWSNNYTVKDDMAIRVPGKRAVSYAVCPSFTFSLVFVTVKSSYFFLGGGGQNFFGRRLSTGRIFSDEENFRERFYGGGKRTFQNDSTHCVVYFSSPKHFVRKELSQKLQKRII